MKKNIVVPIIASLSLIAISSSLAIFTQSNIKARTRAQTYSIIINEDKNQLARGSYAFHNDTETVYTELGNAIQMKYQYSNGLGAINLKKSESGSYGYLMNMDPISGLESITVTTSSVDARRVSVGYRGDASDSQTYTYFDLSSSQPIVFNFNNDHPNFFTLANSSSNDLIIQSIELTYSCNDYYPYLTLTSESTTKGTVSGGNKRFLAGSSVTVYASAKSAYKFEGWYAGETLVSTQTPYTFTMPSAPYSLVAKFIKLEDWQRSKGILPKLDEENNKITYGLYPQTVVKDNTLLSALNSLGSSAIDSNNGYYKYNDDYYYSLIATPNDDGVTSKPYFRSGGAPTAHTIYWFKCEPISWSIVSSSGSIYTLIADECLDVVQFYSDTTDRTISGETIKPNNYEYSTVRAFLNGLNGSSYNAGDYRNDSFIKRAFGLTSRYIKTTEVDNTQSSSSWETNENLCNNTNDKIYLPSYKDVTNLSLQSMFVDDYCAAVGAYMSKLISSLYNNKMWMRTPYNLSGSKYEKQAFILDQSNSKTSTTVTASGTCIRPMMTVNLNP